MKIAILHEMFVKLGWAENVVETFLEIFPDADLFTLIYDEKKVWKKFPKEKINKQVFSLITQKIYNLFNKQRLCLPFMASSIEKLDFSEYDVVLSSSSWFAHWAITKPETKFIVYYHSPSRYLWDYTNEYKKSIWFNSWIKAYFLNKLFLKLRIWDVIAGLRTDIPLIASNHAWKRIKKYYKRDDYKVIYPPVEVNNFINYKKNISKKDYYITIAALTEWKKIDIAINAFNKIPEKKLKIIWIWDYEKEYKKLVKWNNIEFLWYKSWEQLISYLKNAKWFIFCSEEDFWIAPVEAMACWLPVLWLAKWWLTETNLEWISGEFFYDNNWNDFLEKFLEFDKNIDNKKYDINKIIENSKKFSKQNFIKQIKKIVEN